MTKKFILLLGANQFQRERALIGAERAFKGMVVTTSSLAPFHTNKYPSITIFSNENSPEQLLIDVIAFCSKTQMTPIAVVPLNDFVLNAGLKIAEHFELPYNSKNTIATCRTKDLMKSTLISANLPVVQSFRFSTLDEAKELAKKIGYPLVIKPLNFGGSGGVVKVENESELAGIILQTQTHLNKFAKKYDSDFEHMLMESYISIKREVSVEIINTPDFRSVIGITDKFLSQEPYFSEIGHLVPSSFHQDITISNKIKETALRACKALNILYGMAHVEMKVGSDGEIIIIEIGVRTAGDGIMDLYEKSTQTNIYELHCKAFLNQLSEEDLPKEFISTAAIGYLHPANGIVEEIKPDLLTSADLENVDLISIQTKVGQKIEAAKDWSTRNGFVEYTMPKHHTTNEFDLIETTNAITKKIFSIKEEQ
jgi:phosphoribosylaminoimidazole carboxylase (NCAIR synthetase)